MTRGRIKVMIGTNGVPRIQEETNDGQIRVFTLEGWNEELEKRRAAKDEAAELAPDVEVETDDTTGDDGLIQEDDEDEDDSSGPPSFGDNEDE